MEKYISAVLAFVQQMVTSVQVFFLFFYYQLIIFISLHVIKLTAWNVWCWTSNIKHLWFIRSTEPQWKLGSVWTHSTSVSPETSRWHEHFLPVTTSAGKTHRQMMKRIKSQDHFFREVDLNNTVEKLIYPNNTTQCIIIVSIYNTVNVKIKKICFIKQWVQCLLLNELLL